MKKLLIFDAYGTLLSTGRGSVNACEKILSLQEKSIDPIAFYADWKKLHRAHIDKCIIHGFVPEEDIFTRDLAALYEMYGIDRPQGEDVQIMLRSLTGRRLFPEVKETIRQLKKRARVVIGSTSDTAPLLHNLAQNELDVDAVYTSESLRRYKPDPDFYRAILAAEDCAAKDAVFIGDSPTDDVMGPRAAGLTTVLIDRTGKYAALPEDKTPDFYVSTLGELLQMYDIH